MNFKFLHKRKLFTHSKKILLIVLPVLVLILGILFLFVWNNFLPTERGSQITYLTKDRSSEQEKTDEGRIIALPGESVRFSLQNDNIYIKRGNASYKVIENYLPESTSTLSLSFSDGWHKLAEDEILVLKDQRNIQTMTDFIYEDNIINKSQISSTKKVGKRSDITLQPINESKEFAVKVNRSWLAWQTQLDEPINIKNNAVPVVNKDLVFVPIAGNKLVVLDANTGRKKWETSFTNIISKISPDPENAVVQITTWDNEMHNLNDKTVIFDARSGKKIEEKSSTITNESVTTPLVVIGDNHFMLEKLPNVAKLTKNDGSGKVIWQYTSNDMKYFPVSFKQYGKFLVGMGGYGGNSMEDVPYKSSVYVLNADNGKLITIKSNLGYANFDVIDHVLIIRDQNLQGYDLTTGKVLWTYPIKDDSGANYTDWVVDQGNHTIYAADKQEVVALNKDGIVVWSKRIETSTRRLRLKNGNLYLLDQGKSLFYALDLATGNTLWQISTINGSEGPHITDQSQVFFKNLRRVKFQFTQTEFFALDPVTKTPQRIFDYTTRSDNDLLFQYTDPYIFVFTDDFVTAIKYKSN